MSVTPAIAIGFLLIQAGVHLFVPVEAQQQPVQQRISPVGAPPLQQASGVLPGGIARQQQVGVAGAHPGLAGVNNPALQGRGQLGSSGLQPIGAGQQPYQQRIGDTTPGAQLGADATGRFGAPGDNDPARQGLPGPIGGGLKPGGLGQTGTVIQSQGMNVTRIGQDAAGKLTNGNGSQGVRGREDPTDRAGQPDANGANENKFSAWLAVTSALVALVFFTKH